MLTNAEGFTCPWRIAQLARTSAFSEFDTMPHAPRSHPFRSFDRHLDETCKTGRRPIGRCGVCPCKASNTDFESIEKTIKEFTCIGSNQRRFVRTADASRTRYPLCNRAQTVNSSSFPPCSGETKVSHPVFPKTQAQAVTKRTFERTYRRDCRDEAA